VRENEREREREGEREPSRAERGERVNRGQAPRKRQGPRPYHSMARPPACSKLFDSATLRFYPTIVRSFD